LIDVLPLLMSSFVLEMELCGASGSAKGVLGVVESDSELVDLDSPFELAVELMVKDRCAGSVRVRVVNGTRRAKVWSRGGICRGEAEEIER